MRNVNNYKIVTIIIAIFVATALIISGVAYGVGVSFTVDIINNYTAATEHFNINNSGTYKENFALSAGSPTIATSLQRINYANQTVDNYDLLVFLADGSATLDTQTGITYTLSTGKCILFKNMVFGANDTKNITLNLAGVTAQVAKVVVVTSSAANRYVSSFFDLQMLNNEAMHNADYDENVPAGQLTYYKNVYILDSFVVDKKFAINYPCYINLLYATVTLNAELSVSHSDKGAYEVETISGVINNDNKLFTISSPRAYYRTEANSIVTNVANFVKNSNNIDFKNSKNAVLLEALLQDASTYIKNNFPQNIFKDIVLPKSYHDYGVEFSYASDNTLSLAPSGKVNRQADTKAVNLTTTVAFGATTKTVVLPIKVVGATNAAFTSGFADTFTEFYKRSGVTSGNKTILKQPLAIMEFINDYVASFEYAQDFAISLPVSKNVFFMSGDNIYTDLAFTYSAVDKAYKVALNNNAPVSANGVFVTINPQDWLLNESSEVMTIKSNLAESTVTLSLVGITLAEQRNYLERYIETVYFSTSNDVASVLRVDTVNGGIYNGNISTTPVIPYTLGFSDVVYNFHLVNKADLVKLQQGTMTLDALVASGVNYNEFFNLTTPGIIKPAPDKVLTVADTKALILHMSFIDGKNGNYNTYRQVVIPSAGLGGNDYIEYIKGNTYGAYFDNLKNGKLIDSVADKAGVPGSAYKFTVDTAGVNLVMSVATAGVDSFCKMVKTNNYYQIDINVDNVPSKNTLINVVAVFYTTNIYTPISTQNYSFIIPGIYRFGKDFGDFAVYEYVRNLKVNNAYVFESYDKYLLTDSASAECALLDCSLVNLVGKTAADTIDIRGIELLVNTKALKFDGCKLASLAPFNAYTTYNVLELSMANCSITDTMLRANSLYAQKNLIKLNLDGNSISSFEDANGKPLIYRTVTELSINNQANRMLTSLQSLKTLNNIAILNVKDNGIASFAPLTALNRLKTLFVENNVATEFTSKTAGDTLTYYGTNGEINIPIFVALMDKGVTVYLTSSTTFNSTVNKDKYLGSLVLNAIVIASTAFGDIKFPNTAIEYTDKGVPTGLTFALTAKYIILNNAVATVNPSHAGGVITLTTEDKNRFAGQELKLIVSVTYNAQTVYKEFVFNYKKVSA